MKPAELALLILSVLQTVLLLVVLLKLRQSRQEPARTPDFEALARGLEAPFKRLAAEWTAEHQRLREQTAQATDLVARLTRLQFQASLAGPEAESGAERSAEPVAAVARQEARQRLLAGESVEQVADATGLPDGEIRVLAAVLKRGG